MTKNIAEQWKKQVKSYRKSLNLLPKKGRYDLGSKGISLLSKINKFESKIDKSKIKRSRQ